jgi:hypothetical protein
MDRGYLPLKKRWCQWLRTVILATQEAEIRKMAVQSQSRQIGCETLSKKTHHKKLEALSSNPSAS